MFEIEKTFVLRVYFLSHFTLLVALSLSFSAIKTWKRAVTVRLATKRRQQ